jgi:rod shape-determining protein MreD
MDRSLRFTLVSAALLAAALLIQTTVLEHVAIRGIKPDLALIVLVFVAVQGGAMAGQVAGFAAGLAQDLLSLSPLGLGAFVRTIIGHVYGRLQGALASSSVLASVVMVFAATVVKGALLWLVTSLLAPDHGVTLTIGSLIELAYNAALAPLLFAGLGRIRSLRAVEKKEAGA